MPLNRPPGGFTDETAFNKWLRSRIRGRGYQCIHVREADFPGPLDLLVWTHNRVVAWIELKLDDRAVEPSQLEFMRGLRKGGTTHCVVRYRQDVEVFEVTQMNSEYQLGLVFSTTSDSELLDNILI